MKTYYLFLSRVSLAVLLIQATYLIYNAIGYHRLERQLSDRIDQWSIRLDATLGKLPGLRATRTQTALTIIQIKDLLVRQQWVLKAWIVGTVLHLTCLYTLYLHFLRWGYTWTKFALHANNLSLTCGLPGLAALIYCVAYLALTRAYKHKALAQSFED